MAHSQTEGFTSQKEIGSSLPLKGPYDYPARAENYNQPTSFFHSIRRYLPVLTFDLTALTVVLILTYEFNRSNLLENLFVESQFLTANLDRVLFYTSVVFLTLISFYWNGLYRHNVIQTRIKQFALIARSMFITGACVVLFSFLFLNSTISESFKDFLTSYVLVGILVVFVVRLVFRHLIRSKSKFSTLKPIRNIIIIGAGEEAKLYAASRANSDTKKIVFLDDDESKFGQHILGYPIEGKPEDVAFKAITTRANEICIIIKNIKQQRLLEIIQHCKKTGVPTKVLSSHYNLMFTGLYSKTNSLLETIPLENRTSKLDLVLKRGMDLLAVLLALPIVLIPCLIIALIVKVSSPGPVFYKSSRVGKRGKLFTIYKFRSMKVNVEVQHKEAALRRLKNGLHMGKVNEDPRITRFGKFLRKYCLDELPQLINVTKGEMSLIGPRPCFQYEMKMFEEWHNRRFLMKPGITGFWQVTGRQIPNLMLNDAMTTDVFYTDNYSIWMDFRIILKTIPVILNGKGK